MFRRFVFCLAGVLPLLSAATPPTLTTLQPGGFRTITQTLDVNVVFVGYQPGAGPQNVNLAQIRSLLPASYTPVHRYPSFYGLPAEFGLKFNF
ncbi:MAG: hypothetical protein JNL98_40900, partial [Bryobacterales bacterium]|nr:hypothetical protein [Bryobacterales bacterium]